MAKKCWIERNKRKVKTVKKYAELRQKLKAEKDPDKRQEIMMDLQQAMQMRTQMISMLSNLMKSEHDAAMAVADAGRGQVSPRTGCP